MATKITNVYVKNRAAGETSFKEVNSVDAGSTRVFEKAKNVAVTTPEGVIPLKYSSSGTGPYGGYRSLYTSSEMRELPYSSCFGVLLMPIQYMGHIYVPEIQPVISGTPSYYLLRVGYNTRNGSIANAIAKVKIYGSEASTPDWDITEKNLTNAGGSLYAPTLTTTLYKVYYDDFADDPDRGQYSILCNKQSPITQNVIYYEMEYVRLVSSTPTEAPSTITVRSNSAATTSPATEKYPLVYSKRDGTGIKFSVTSNLFVN